MKIVAAIVAVLVIVGAGAYALVKHSDSSDNSSSSTSSSKDSSSTSQSSTSSDPSADISADDNAATSTTSVTIDNFAFSPAIITVHKGQTVTWTNKDSTAHTVSETDGQDGPRSEDLNQGQTYSFTFSKVGTFKYDCSIHPNMTGTVVVTE